MNVILDPINNKESTVSIEENDKQLEIYKERLISSHIKTLYEIEKMKDEEIIKIYLTHEKNIAEQMKSNLMKLLAKSYVKAMNMAIPIINNNAKIEQEEKLEEKLSKDVFIGAFLDQYFPDIYYRYGSLLAPISLAAHTASHITIGETTAVPAAETLIKNSHIENESNNKDKSEENKNSFYA